VNESFVFDVLFFSCSPFKCAFQMESFVTGKKGEKNFEENLNVKVFGWSFGGERGWRVMGN
jgi:hypothetical protein